MKLIMAGCFLSAFLIINITIWAKDNTVIKCWPKDKKFRWGVTSFGMSALLMFAGVILIALQILSTCCYQ